MPITAPPSITALPTPPDPNDRSTFNTRAYPWSVAQQTFGTQVGAVATNVYDNALEAQAQATAATSAANTATTQANNAAQSAIDANGAAVSAINAFDQFDDRYLGAKSSNPALDNDGNALQTGALYWNTSVPEMRVWTGTAWQVAAGSLNANLTIIREVQTAGSGQTIFNLTNTYTPGLNTLMVYRNGARLLNSEYTETNINTVTLASAATLGDELLFEIGVVSTGPTSTAGATSFNPAGNIAATNVQAAIAELDTEKRALREGVSVISTNTNAVAGATYILTASLTLTLPASPNAGDWVAVQNSSGTTTATIARNGSNIMSLAENLTLDADFVSVRLVYADATRGWVFGG